VGRTAQTGTQRAVRSRDWFERYRRHGLSPFPRHGLSVVVVVVPAGRVVVVVVDGRVVVVDGRVVVVVGGCVVVVVLLVELVDVVDVIVVLGGCAAVVGSVDVVVGRSDVVVVTGRASFAGSVPALVFDRPPDPPASVVGPSRPTRPPVVVVALVPERTSVSVGGATSSSGRSSPPFDGPLVTPRAPGPPAACRMRPSSSRPDQSPTSRRRSPNRSWPESRSGTDSCSS